MADFHSLLSSIARRPGMYVGTCSIWAVSCYLDGYLHAVRDGGEVEPSLNGWTRWVESRYLIAHPGWHWTRILLHIYGHDQAALDALPELYEQFVACRSSIGVAGIEAEHERRFIAEYGQSWHEPAESAATPDAR